MNSSKNQSKSNNRGRRANRAPVRMKRASAMQRAPVATSRRTTTNKPRMTTQTNGTTVTHREFIGDIAGSVDYATNGYALNPGLASTFPWLSKIAANYESYVFRKLSFQYETAVATTTAGTVMMAVDYDATDLAPTSKQSLMAYAQAQRSAPWQESSFNCRGGDLTKFARERYIRTSSGGGDLKTYDVGNLFVATQGTPATDLGELYVTYTVILRTPQVGGGAPPPASGGGAQFGLSSDVVSAVALVIPFDVAIVNTISAVNTAGSITLAAGTYSFSIDYRHTGGYVDYFSLYVNGAATTPPRISELVGDGNTSLINLSGLITLVSNDVVTVYCTGAAGTSTIKASDTHITFLKL